MNDWVWGCWVQEFRLIRSVTSFEKFTRNLLNFSVALYRTTEIKLKFQFVYFICKLVLWFTMPPIKAVMHDCFFDTFPFFLTSFTIPFIKYNTVESRSYDDFHQWYANFFLSLFFKYPYYFSWLNYLRVVFVELLNLHLLIPKRKWGWETRIRCVPRFELKQQSHSLHNLFSQLKIQCWKFEKLFRLFLHFNRLSINCDICCSVQ